MRNTAHSLLFFALVLAATTLALSGSASAATIKTDKLQYAQGEAVVVTAANNAGTNAGFYMSCSGVFFTLSDQTGRTLPVLNPAIKAPCERKALSPGESVSYSWNQKYFQQVASGYRQAQAQPGNYRVVFNAESDPKPVAATFSITASLPSATPTPSPSGGVTIATNKAAYQQGETVALTATNRGTAGVQYNLCFRFFNILDASGNQLQIDPNYGRPCRILTLEPGEAVTDNWDQFYYGSKTGGRAQAPSGTYAARFNAVDLSINARTDFAILGGPTPTVTPNPTPSPSPTCGLGDFCGTSTNGPCAADSDCVRDGCSAQVCRSAADGPVITTCEYRACYDANRYNAGCGCVAGQCQWRPNSCAPKPTPSTTSTTTPTPSPSPTLPPHCGNKVCEPKLGETPLTCPQDCPGTNHCGNGICEPQLGETPNNCPLDCRKVQCEKWQEGKCAIIQCGDGFKFNSCTFCRYVPRGSGDSEGGGEVTDEQAPGPSSQPQHLTDIVAGWLNGFGAMFGR
ncbi:eight-cysteine-cluster domain-containing protein [Candidatus Micrarchaeota archaeon]|nr:eight-cysteine-cluster domain-containing protein [Candidatus Micrarchaeota archaeon]